MAVNRWRVLVSMLTCSVLIGVSVLPAAAAEESDPRYLALGDSVAFGYSPLKDPHDASNFVGYPEALAGFLDLNLTNASCPGEASGGFISLTGTDNSCRPYRAAPFPLHTSYTTSQLDFAVAYLRAHPNTRLVTLDIGANDVFVLVKQCAPAPNPPACVQAGFPALLKTLSANLGIIYGRIRNDAHYHGQLVALTYYVTNYNDPVSVPLFQALNATIAQATLAARGRVADGFDAFKFIAAFAGGDACAAGLLIVTNPSPRTCDIHPSPLGRDVLAGAVTAVVRVRHALDE